MSCNPCLVYHALSVQRRGGSKDAGGRERECMEGDREEGGRERWRDHGGEMVLWPVYQNCCLPDLHSFMAYLHHPWVLGHLLGLWVLALQPLLGHLDHL